MDNFEYPPDSTEKDYRIHTESFEVWCFGVMMNQVPAVAIQINPFDDVVREFSNEYHRTCFGNKVAGPTSQGTSNILGPSNITNSALELLAKSVADMLSRQLTFQKELKEKKKDKTKEWHASMKKMILNCASEDGKNPAASIPKSYRDIINCKSIGLALQSIQAGMNQRGHKEVGWPESLGQSLQKGLLLYKSMDKPSGLTALCLYVSQPLSANMSSRGVDYLYKKIEDFTKMAIHVPPNIDEMCIVLDGFHGLIEIVFGEKSILAKKWMQGIEAIKNDRAWLRANMALDLTLIAKMLYKFICTSRGGWSNATTSKTANLSTTTESFVSSRF